MKNSNEVFRAKHPKVITFCTNREEIDGALAVITDTVIEHRIVDLTKETYQPIQRMRPQLILLALHTVEQSVQVYYELLEEVPFCQGPLKVVLLCQKSQTELAYHLCIKGVFDSFVVVNPLYETYWLKFAIASVFSHDMNNHPHLQTIQFEFFEKLNSDLEQVINKTIALRNQYQAAYKSSIETSHSAKTINTVEKPTSNSQADDHEFKQLIHLMKQMDGNLQKEFDRLSHQLLEQRTLIQFQIKQAEEQLNHHNHEAHQSDHIPHTAQNDEVSYANTGHDIDSHHQADQKFTWHDEKLTAQQYLIMIVDDDPVYAEVLNKVLRSRGYETLLAASGQKAIELLEHQVPDLILLDLFMPDLDGVETTKHIKSRPALHDIPIIGLSGNREKKAIIEWARLGLSDYIIKPSSKKNILNKVAEVLFSREMNSLT